MGGARQEAGGPVQRTPCLQLHGSGGQGGKQPGGLAACCRGCRLTRRASLSGLGLALQGRSVGTGAAAQGKLLAPRTEWWGAGAQAGSSTQSSQHPPRSSCGRRPRRQPQRRRRRRCTGTWRRARPAWGSEVGEVGCGEQAGTEEGRISGRHGVLVRGERQPLRAAADEGSRAAARVPAAGGSPPLGAVAGLARHARACPSPRTQSGGARTTNCAAEAANLCGLTVGRAGTAVRLSCWTGAVGRTDRKLAREAQSRPSGLHGRTRSTPPLAGNRHPGADHKPPWRAGGRFGMLPRRRRRPPPLDSRRRWAQAQGSAAATLPFLLAITHQRQ